MVNRITERSNAQKPMLKVQVEPLILGDPFAGRKEECLSDLNSPFRVIGGSTIGKTMETPAAKWVRCVCLRF